MNKLQQTGRGKSLLLLAIFALMSGSAWAQNYNFTATVSDNTLYFKITDAEHHYVKVVAPNGTDWNGYAKPTGNIELPSMVTNDATEYTLTEVGGYAFYECSGLTGITFPSSITTIGSYAFKSCGFTSLDVNVPTISSYAFSYCSSLETLTIGPAVSSVSVYAFMNCSALESINYNALGCSFGQQVFSSCTHSCTVTIGSEVTSLPTDIFYGFPGLHSFSNWGGVTSIGHRTFRSSGLTTISIPDAVTSIGEHVFESCSSLTSASFGSGLSTTGNYTFNGCSNLESVTLGTNITTIGDYAFSECKKLTIDNSTFNWSAVTSIRQYAFYKCEAITGIALPSGITSLGSYAFQFCANLNVVTVPNTANLIAADYGVFSNTAGDLCIYVPAARINEYKSTNWWKSYADHIFGWVSKTVEGYGTSTATNDKWAFIASPLTVTNLLPTQITGLVAAAPNEYDLYRLNNTMWENYKAHTEGFVLENGYGYLYANKEGVTLTFVGDMFTDASKDVTLQTGWNLVGNPYGEAAYINRSYYKMNTAGTNIEPVAAYTTTTIPACTSVVVEGASNTDEVTFSKTAPSKSAGNGNLQVTVERAGDRNNGVQDMAIVSFDKGAQLGKFVFNEDYAKLYIPQGGEDYAIAYSDGQGELPLNFEAVEDGIYTIVVDVKGLEIDYLHLIDNLTGADVDLLATNEGDARHCVSTYTFEAKTTDFVSRFRLVFNANSGNADGDYETFAFINADGNIVIEGEGMIQVVDVMGRIVICRDGVHTVSTAGMVPAVYVLRLINGEDVKVQKIVVR